MKGPATTIEIDVEVRSMGQISEMDMVSLELFNSKPSTFFYIIS